MAADELAEVRAELAPGRSRTADRSPAMPVTTETTAASRVHRLRGVMVGSPGSVRICLICGHLIFQGRGVYKGEAGCAARSQCAGAGSVGRAVKKRMMSSAAVGDSIIAWTRADISAIG